MDYYEELRHHMVHRPLLLPGSFVIILNDKNEILSQERKPGVFGFPAGLMDIGVSLEETVRREVLEGTV
ncbi:NUDIX domain-containing protein [Paenisporosarcina sp. FSL H8-0542]|uniref:NUDIX domain-containing protein n=1 Tax=Paenisporosarcina sp. FSL H8-0542 TaxID=2921401 RepID=UPI003159CE61